MSTSNSYPPETEKELREMAVSQNADGRYFLSNGLVVRWQGSIKVVGLWDPPLK